jgi:antitoxin (DNA-binding transcriptional repressor) of toxin-antitoxin stability system
MQLVQFTDFRNNASRYLDMVEHQGETVQIWRSGKPVAQIIPQPNVSAEIVRRDPSWKNRVWKRLPLKDANGPSVSELLNAQRDGEI